MTAQPGTPQVSVIVRSMARASLDDALASIAKQRDVEAEVVVVAACGASHPELPPHAGPHPIRLVRSDVRLPRSQAANAGLDAARGTWITLLDDDDVFLDDHLVGLLAAAREAPHARVITSYAKAVFRDGHVEYFGQPFSRAQLFERNFVHLSSALFARELVLAGCRFDEALEVLEDWELVLQLAQRARVHFVPLASFQWHADIGDSGAGGGTNHDEAKFARNRERVYAKWGPVHDALVAQTQPLLQRAASLAQAGRLAEADQLCGQVLALSENDPWALNLRAMLLRRSGKLAQARAMQAFAVSVRPQDGGFVYNLALIEQALGDLEAARRHAQRAASLDPDFEPARALVRELSAST